MPHGPVAPIWPFGRWFRVPKLAPGQRQQCGYCCGGGEVNGCPCPGGCDGRGWFDAANPPPKKE